MPTVRAIVRDAAAREYRFSSIVLGIVRSDAFLKSMNPAAAPPMVTRQAAVVP